MEQNYARLESFVYLSGNNETLRNTDGHKSEHGPKNTVLFSFYCLFKTCRNKHSRSVEEKSNVFLVDQVVLERHKNSVKIMTLLSTFDYYTVIDYTNRKYAYNSIMTYVDSFLITFEEALRTSPIN